MTLRGTILLWAAVAALGLYLWSGERLWRGLRGAPRSESPAAPAAPLLRVDAAQVDTIEIADAIGTLRFRRDGAGWRDTNGKPWPTPERVNALVKALAELLPLRVIAATPERLADYGLDPPRQRVTFTLRGGAERLTLVLGNPNPTSTAVYALSDAAENGVVLVGSAILWEIDKITRTANREEHPQLPAPSR